MSLDREKMRKRYQPLRDLLSEANFTTTGICLTELTHVMSSREVMKEELVDDLRRVLKCNAAKTGLVNSEDRKFVQEHERAIQVYLDPDISRVEVFSAFTVSVKLAGNRFPVFSEQADNIIDLARRHFARPDLSRPLS